MLHIPPACIFKKWVFYSWKKNEGWGIQLVKKDVIGDQKQFTEMMRISLKLFFPPWKSLHQMLTAIWRYSEVLFPWLLRKTNLSIWLSIIKINILQSSTHSLLLLLITAMCMVGVCVADCVFVSVSVISSYQTCFLHYIDVQIILVCYVTSWDQKKLWESKFIFSMLLFALFQVQ